METLNSSVKLKGDSNWNIWKFQMKVVLTSKGLFDITNGNERKPEEGSLTDGEFEKAVNDWNLKDSKAQEMLVTRIEEGPMVHILTCESAYMMWTKLLSVFEKRSEVSLHLLQQKFFNTKYEGENMSEFISKIEELTCKLKQFGENVSEQMVITKILISLPSSFSHFVSAWESVPSGEQKLSELTSRLLIEEERLNERSSQESALLTKRFSNFNIKCYSCGSKGHLQKNCHQNYRRQFETKNVGSKNELKCFYCNKKGHVKKDCWFKAKEVRGREFLAKKDSENMERGDLLSYNSKSRNGKNAFVGIDHALFCDLKPDCWYIDSGATQHMCCEEKLFSNIDLLTEEKKVMVGNGTLLDCKGIGVINVLAFNGHEWIPTKISDVLFVPGLRINLFSLNVVLSKGYRVEWNENECVIFNSSERCAKGSRAGKLYTMDFKYVNDFAGVTVKYSLMEWHEKLAHQHIDQVRATLRKHNIIVNENESFFCESCLAGKQQRSNFKPSEVKTNEPCQIVHADLCGPMEVTSLGGSKYFLLLKDDFSKYCNVYFMKHKSEVAGSIKDFLKLAKNDTGKEVKILRSDNGLEFVNQDIKKLTESQGIRHQRSAAYCPEQNGKAEREIRTVVEAARTMLQARGMDKKFWAEAVNSAVYVINRTGTSRISGKSRYECWFGKTPESLGYFQVFGIDAYAHVPNQKKRKWDAKTRKGMFIGYQENSKAYRIYFPDSNRIEVMRNVVFKPYDIKNQKVASEEQRNLHLEEESVVDDSECGKPQIPGNETDRSSHPNETQEDGAIENEPTEEGNKSDMETVCKKGNEKSKTYNLRSRDQIKKSMKFTDFETSFLGSEEGEPKTYSEAVQSCDASKWKKAIEEELQVLQENNTWSEVIPPENCKTVGTKWVFKIKTEENGKPSQYKARLVAKGFQQKEHFDLSEIYSPVAKLTTMRVLLAVANKENMPVYQMDVRSAFLYGEIDEDVYLKTPEGVTIGNGTVLKLNKSLYGLKKSPKYWNQKFNKCMLQNGFIQSKNDCCLYSKLTATERLYVLLYVDDILIVGSDEAMVDELKKTLSENFKMKDLGAVRNFLGINISQNREKGEIRMNQSKFLQSILEEFGMENCRPVSTPMDPNFTLNSCQMSEIAEERDELESKCRKLIGKLMYTMLGTRPDLSTAISILSRHQNKPSQELWAALKRVLRYIKGTVNLNLIYKKDEVEKTVKGYVDADWAGNTQDRKSTTGYVFLLWNCAVSWVTKKQQTVALSSTESEYVAMSSATAEACWLKSILTNDFKIMHENESVLILEDNQGAINTAKNVQSHKRMKHIDIKHHFIREKVLNKVIQIEYVCSPNQIADVLTKPLNKDLFHKCINGIGLRLVYD